MTWVAESGGWFTPMVVAAMREVRPVPVQI
jgi:hypothetical protein